MSHKIYVGNLPYSVTNASLESNFSEFGSVTSAKIMMDRDTGRSKVLALSKWHRLMLASRPLMGLTAVLWMAAQSP